MMKRINRLLFPGILGMMACICLSSCRPVTAQPHTETEPEPMDNSTCIENETFSLLLPEGFEANQADNMVYIHLPNGDEQSGPGITINTGTYETQVTAAKLLEVIMENSSSYEFSDPFGCKLDQKDALCVDFTTVYHAPDGVILDSPGASEGDEITGKIIVALLGDYKSIRVTLLTPAMTRDEYDPILNAVIASIKILE